MNSLNKIISSSGIKFGPFWLSPGISRTNVLAMFSIGFLGMVLLPFISFIQPMMFEKLLQIPSGKQGTLTANLGLINDFIALTVMVYIGALSDRIGRQVIAALGFVGLGIALFIYPYASDLTQLYLFRALVGLAAGVVSVMLTTIQHDYPQERSRAKLIGTNSIFTGFGVLFTTFVILSLPKFFEDSGYSSEQAIRYTFTAVMGFALLAAIVAKFWLHGGLPDEEHRSKSIFHGIKDTIAAARANPRLSLAFLAGFTARGDLAIAGTYFALWFMNVGTAQGMDASTITKTSGQYFGILSLMIMLWAPLFGIFADRIDRISAAIIGLSIAGAGYTFMGSIGDPFSSAFIIPACILLGMGESSAIISCASLAGSQAPGRIRGAVMGFFSLSGTLGILFLSFISGLLFDQVGPTAPFMMMGILNFSVVAVALFVRLKYGKDQLEPTAPASI